GHAQVLSSAALASVGAPDVFMGLDCFVAPGRSARGFDAGHVVGVALQGGALAAVFAAAWVYEIMRLAREPALTWRSRGYGTASARPATRTAPCTRTTPRHHHAHTPPCNHSTAGMGMGHRGCKSE
ncbi:unnamed protein product, partial [Closterium sp. Naga37s-1]